ncbi:hypothetical protein LTR37_009111 [Vermiconidia calcicola]|uniref:Uncharacterized protein n=1 Tax=Vermiconidia calcicola TaxID=1690605 RepID=A0ACC3N8M3_9PEZI|nr:hypothetical protein LTR37_009111 [Vermiconidia calcicola]
MATSSQRPHHQQAAIQLAILPSSNGQQATLSSAAPSSPQATYQASPAPSPAVASAAGQPITASSTTLPPNAAPSTGGFRPIAQFLLKTTVGNVVAMLGCLLTFIGLAWAFFTGITTYQDVKWSRQNEALQACASLYSIGKFTKYCNQTLDIGVTPAHPFKRLLRPNESVEDASLNVWFAISMATVVTIALACIVTRAVLTRPRMQAFSPTTLQLEQLEFVSARTSKTEKVFNFCFGLGVFLTRPLLPSYVAPLPVNARAAALRQLDSGRLTTSVSHTDLPVRSRKANKAAVAGSRESNQEGAKRYRWASRPPV